MIEINDRNLKSDTEPILNIINVLVQCYIVKAQVREMKLETGNSETKVYSKEKRTTNPNKRLDWLEVPCEWL